MSVEEIARWAMLGLHVVAAVTRVLDARRGVNWTIVVYFALVSVAISLSLPTFYIPLDAVLGRHNVVNLVLRFLNFGAVLIIGRHVARAYGASLSERAITGRAGWIAFGSVGGLMTVFFVLSNTVGSSTGLAALMGQDTLLIYSALGFLFPAYVATCLLGPVFSDIVAGDESFVNKLASWLLFAGLVGVGIQPVVQMTGFAAKSLVLLPAIVPFISLGLVCISLTTMWLANRWSFTSEDEEKVAGPSRPVLRLVGPEGVR